MGIKCNKLERRMARLHCYCSTHSIELFTKANYNSKIAVTKKVGKQE